MSRRVDYSLIARLELEIYGGEPFYRESLGCDGYLRWCSECRAMWTTSAQDDPFGPTLACPVCRVTAVGNHYDGPTRTYRCPARHELEVPEISAVAWIECSRCKAERKAYDGRWAGPLERARPVRLNRS